MTNGTGSIAGQELTPSDEAILARLVAECGSGILVHPHDTASRVMTVRGELMPPVPLLRPACTDEVVRVVKAVREAGRSLIPVGGATGLVHAIAPDSGREWYISFERMRKIERIDTRSRVAVVEAGVVLHTLQEDVANKGMLFAMDLGSRGTATIGGLINTNAGGERVLRFGMMRQQILGLEVVTADGQVLDMMSEVLKNNSGYDIKQLFIGSEGTLGLVTRAVVRLRPQFVSKQAAMLAIRLDRLSETLSQIERGLGGTLSACELMWASFMDLMTGEGAPHRLPLAERSEAYLLIEAEGGDIDADQARFISMLEGLLDSGLITDAAIAQSEAERRAMWAIRNDIPHLVSSFGSSVGFDISVPIADMVDYANELEGRLRAKWPDIRHVVFGHVADNNLHVTATVGPNTSELRKEISEVVYQGVIERRGSISAEHGIGLDKRSTLHKQLPPPVLALMRQMKQVLDPDNILNPGKVV